MEGFVIFTQPIIQATDLLEKNDKLFQRKQNMEVETTQVRNEKFRVKYRELSRSGGSEEQRKQCYENFQNELQKKGEQILTSWFFFDSHFDHCHKMKLLRDRRRKQKEEEEDMEIWKADTLSLFNLTDRQFVELDFCGCKGLDCFTCQDYASDEQRRQKLRKQGFVFNGEFHFENFNDDLTLTAVKKEELEE